MRKTSWIRKAAAKIASTAINQVSMRDTEHFVSSVEVKMVVEVEVEVDVEVEVTCWDVVGSSPASFPLLRLVKI